MESTALDLGLAGWDDFYGYGLIQMDAALAAYVAPASSPPINTAPAGGGIIFNPTWTASPTLTLTITASPTVMIDTATVTLTPTDGPDLIALATGDEPSAADPGPESPKRSGWMLGCFGILLILIGLVLFLAVRRYERQLRS
jgi:hypothetical protein